MATYTTNFSLKKPDGSDTVNISDINGNMDIIDEELENTAKMAVKSISVSGNRILITFVNGKQVAGTIYDASTSASGLMSKSDKSKLDGLSVKTASAASSITSGTKIGTVTINGTTTTFYYKDTVYNVATSSANGLMSKSDKAKLDTITTNADTCVFVRTLSSGTKIGTIYINGVGTDLYSTNNTTYSVATTSSNGLMSSSHVAKLSHIGEFKEWSGSINVTAGSWSNAGSFSLSKGVWVITATGWFDAEQYGVHCVGISKNSKITNTQDPKIMNQALAGGVKTSLQKTRIIEYTEDGYFYFGAFADGSYVTVNYAIQAARLS